MKYYIYIENDKLNGAGCAKCLNEDIQNIEVSEQICQELISDSEKYIFSSGEIIQNPDYEKILKEREKTTKISEIISQLNELDQKRIRAVCENQIKDEKTEETWLEYYNYQASELRNKLKELE